MLGPYQSASCMSAEPSAALLCTLCALNLIAASLCNIGGLVILQGIHWGTEGQRLCCNLVGMYVQDCTVVQTPVQVSPVGTTSCYCGVMLAFVTFWPMFPMRLLLQFFYTRITHVCTVLDDATGHGRQCIYKLRGKAMPHSVALWVAIMLVVSQLHQIMTQHD